MFLAAGVGAYVAALFHVVTHAFFKACLFLGSGSVIHACGGEQDMRKMGGLKKHMPKTFWTFLIATVAIAGIPPLAGFVSKDAILAKAFEAGYTDLNGFGNVYWVLWVLGLGGAALTAFYMFRLVYMTFEGSFRGGEEAEHHLHESPWTMTLPLQILAVLSVVGGVLIGFPGQLLHIEGWSFIDRFLAPLILTPGAHGHGGEHGHALSFGLEWVLVVLSVAVAVGGILLARRMYKADPEFTAPRRLAERFPFAYKLVLNKYWVDELYEATVVRPIHGLARFCWVVIDVWVIDTAVNLSAFGAELSGMLLRFLQTGNVRNYALSVALGILVLAAILW
jgi:NADH-quinone oxidoreductase subunit L